MASHIRTFEEFLTTQNTHISVTGLVISLLLAAVLAYVLQHLYVKYGTALSNRRKFAGNFIPLALTTALIITIVKSSLALSLGLVGALSIVRFRAAIKDPEELTFLFLVIAIGLGMGANQWTITVVAFFIIVPLILARHFRHSKESNQNLYLSISGKAGDKVTLQTIVGVLEKHCRGVHLKRFDSDKDILDAAFLVDFDSFSDLESTRDALQTLSKTLRVSYLDREGLR